MFNKIEFDEGFFQHIYNEQVDSSGFVNHQHNLYEVLLIVKGSGSFLIENKKYEYTDRTLFLIAPGNYHVIVPKRDNYERFVINFLPQCVPPSLRTDECKQILVTDALFSLFMKLDEYADLFRGEPLQILTHSFLNEMLVLLTDEKYSPIAPVRFPAIVRAAIEYILQNFDRPLTSASIAAHLFVSQSYLNHLFAKTMHIGLIEYVRMKKMHAAQELLKQGSAVTEVAQSLGYVSYTTFLRNYRDAFHCLPSSVKKCDP